MGGCRWSLPGERIATRRVVLREMSKLQSPGYPLRGDPGLQEESRCHSGLSTNYPLCTHFALNSWANFSKVNPHPSSRMRVIFIVFFVLATWSFSVAQPSQPLRVFVRADAKARPLAANTPTASFWEQLLKERGVTMSSAARFPARAALDKVDVVVLAGASSSPLGRSDRQKLT